MSMNATDTNIAVTPTFAIPTAHEAIARVNRWLHRDLGTAVHAATGDFAGRPNAEEFRQRAEALAVAHGIE